VGTLRAINNVREQEKELVNILIDSVYYLDLDLAERYRLLHFLMDSYLNRPAHGGQKDA
jgi:hypothetical protein